jgi:hypothetical protein
MLDRIATAELQFEPNLSPGALRTRRWREKRANPEVYSFRNEENRESLPEPSPETSQNVTERHTEPVTPRDASPSDTETDFDWNAGDIVQHQCDDVALYHNERGSIVIRRRAHWPDEQDDVFIEIAPECQQAFVDKICGLMGIGSFP